MLDKIIKELVCMVIIVSISTIFGVWILQEWNKRYPESTKWINNFIPSIKIEKQAKVYQKTFETNFNARSIVGKVAGLEYYNLSLRMGTYTHKWRDIKIIEGGEAMFGQQMPKTEMDELLDFYFSKKHATWLRNHTDRERIFFKDREYTECVESKQLPMSSSLYDDLIFIGIGTLKDIKIGE